VRLSGSSAAAAVLAAETLPQRFLGEPRRSAVTGLLGSMRRSFDRALGPATLFRPHLSLSSFS
jgi:hypothetical protein